MTHDSLRGKRSEKFQQLSFSNQADFFQHVIEAGMAIDEDGIRADSKLIDRIQRSWHTQGRNGCIFAVLVAKNHVETRWVNQVFTERIDSLCTTACLERIGSIIRKSIVDTECEVLSLIFSNVVTTSDMVKLIRALLTTEEVLLQGEHVRGKMVTLELRVPVTADGKVLAWLMAFGNYDFFPITRQSPFTEIAIRTKTKPTKLFHRLTPDRDAAHLADTPLDYDDAVKEAVWDQTLKQTRIILGEEPNEYSAARTTFVLPLKDWQSV